MRRAQITRLLGVISLVLTVAVFGTGCDGDKDGNDATPSPTAGALTTAPSAHPTQGAKPSTSPTHTAEPSPSQSTPSDPDSDILGIIKRAGGANLIDISVTNNATCSQKKGETLELGKLAGGWHPSPYATVTGTTESPSWEPSYYDVDVHETAGDPMADWSFYCGSESVGYHTLQFVEISSAAPQITEQVSITVTE